ncbi:MAG: M2 family metallopeptidase [Gemmataceae bacterium]
MLRTLLLGGLALSVTTAALADDATTAQAKAFVADHEKRIRPLDIKAGKAWWDANTTGKDEDFKRKEEIQNELDAALANPSHLADLKELKKAKDAGKIDDTTTARAIDVLYLLYLEKQVEPELLRKITAKANAVEQKFNVFRAKVGNRELPDSEVRKVLKESKDSAEREAVWTASKAVGANVEADLKELVKLRNQAAVQLGFKNYQAMMLTLNEQDGGEIIRLFDELDTLTREPFAKAKAEIDEKLAARCGVKVADLMPWHYDDPFFQESPAVFDADLDAPYKKADILKLC